MILYTDVFTEDAILSDKYKIKEVDGVAYEVECKKLPYTQAEGPDVDGQRPETSNDPAKYIDLIREYMLSDKVDSSMKGYALRLQSYLHVLIKKNTETDPSRVESFKKAVDTYAHKLIADFHNYELYTGESTRSDGMIMLLGYRDNGATPYMIFWKDGLKAQSYTPVEDN